MLNALIKLSLVIFLAVFSANLMAKDIVVEIYKKKFIPASVTIAPGDKVIWKNIEKRQYHNVWFKQFYQEEPDYLFPGDRFEQVFTDAGEFPYVCGPHPKMTGIVIVKK
ncbi:plastocyanin/azurin family copper-binding protein [Thalassotalea psychrophila]|uniref:Plastocyanin/azurin family copper-binding protein n=1 Tax=Thalassotalea psychrophila TaxID=3065647 RepID=A0ABY9TWE1_9GAMM|nr:plastocyanin/azurin family copper-binding protein [Colwelliaceae bacterium SQ149]